MSVSNHAAMVPAPSKELNVIEVGINHPGPGQVLIKNYAIALQPLDAKMLIAGYGPAASLKYPAVLGTSGAGVVQEVGDGVTEIAEGDRVVFDTKAYVQFDENRKQGTWQQLVVCDAGTVAKVFFSHFLRPHG